MQWRGPYEVVKKIGNTDYRIYMYGKEFLQETDHQPLVYLTNAKVSNARLMRLALLLQPFRFRIFSIKGLENVGTDCLSRLCDT
jgi:hypothetical protein